MDRSLSTTSVDNALDSLIFKARFPRSDSEDQFRKFLERIPSTTNLANYQGSMQSLPQIQQQGLQLVSSGPLSAQLPEGGSLNVGGIPRVPSLDLLRQLVAQQQNQGQNGNTKQQPALPAVVKEDPGGAGATSSPGPEPVCMPESSLAGISNASALSMPLPGASFGGSGGSSSQVTTVMPNAPSGLVSAPTKEPRSRDSKAEIRRARRMLSNRESARRSRRRKQEHLGLLEEQIQQLEEERDHFMQQVEKLEKQASHHADQNIALKKENEELRQQLGLEGKDRKSSSHPNKKQCHGLSQ